MYLILGIGVSNLAVINKLKELNKDFIIACKNEEIEKAIKYHDSVISYENIKYLDLNKISYAIKSPGIPYYNLYIKYLKSRHVKVINEIELAYILTNKKGKYIGVSGSVGKSSVVSLLYELIKCKTDNVILAGNIGIPLITYMDKINKETIIILEISSFQLDDFVNLRLHYALLLNIYDNHLDIYKKKQLYYESKFKLANKQTSNDYLIVNLDNKITRNYLLNHSFNSKLLDYKTGFNIISNNLYYYGNKIINLNSYRLKGEHNLDNLKAIVSLLTLLKIRVDEDILSNFETLKYHLEELKVAKYKIINDSKSTSVSSLKSALDTYKGDKITLLFGGYNKNLDFSFLKEYKNVKLICFGKLSYEIEKMVNVDKKFDKLEKAVKSSIEEIKEGETLLFSPGCASFDEFDNYISRAKAFNKYVKEYLDE